MNDYIQKAMRTNSDTVGTYNVHPDLIHGALGLADELIELKAAIRVNDKTNILEEISDCYWFLALLANKHGAHDLFYDIMTGYTPSIQGLEDAIGEVVSSVKRMYAYGKQYRDCIFTGNLAWVANELDALCYSYGSTPQSVMALNIAKLSARYPEKFTPEQANNRDTERERTVLEQNT